MLAIAFAHAGAPGAIGLFSSAPPDGVLPGEWKHVELRGVPRPTTYRLVDDAGTTVLRAEAHAGASVLVHKLATPADPRARLTWRWKIGAAIATGDPTTKAGDDYAARVYVMFDYPLEKLPFAQRLQLRAARIFFDPDLPAAALCYVWDARLPAGTVMESPYTSRVRIVVAESGSRHAGRWITVERDIAEDFRRAFGEEPPAVSAVAVATDTDNTQERLTAWYGDIVLKKRTVTGRARE